VADVLRVHDVHVTRPGARGALPVLGGVDLRVARGELVAVVGPSGCGKSTLLAVVAGLLRPDRGRVLVDGGEVTGPGRVALMPQDDLLLAWHTVLDNVGLGLRVQGVRRREARARARDVLDELGLAASADARPDELSGGMRQRVALARTVLQGRDVVLLDEPFGALDALTRLDAQRWLAATWAAHRWSGLLVTHDVGEAVTLADRVVRLSGRPAAVAQEVVVDDPRPRTPGVPDQRLTRTVLAGLGVGPGGADVPDTPDERASVAVPDEPASGSVRGGRGPAVPDEPASGSVRGGRGPAVPDEPARAGAGREGG